MWEGRKGKRFWEALKTLEFYGILGCKRTE